MKKTLFTLNVNGFAPEVTALTFPLLKHYANKIGADFHVISERKFPDYPVTYEKLQIHDLGRQMKNDWNIFIDADALIHPETPDWTEFLKKDTVAHNGSDMANLRWRYDNYFRRDGRNIGSCNWFALASDWCIDLWQPLDITIAEALDNIYPTVEELNPMHLNGQNKGIIESEHLIDDYTLSRNIAKYGFKFKALMSLQDEIGLKGCVFHWHIYNVTVEQKVTELKKVIEAWRLPDRFFK